MEIKHDIRMAMMEALRDELNQYRNKLDDVFAYPGYLRFRIKDNKGNALIDITLNVLSLDNIYGNMLNINDDTTDVSFIEDPNFFVGFVSMAGLANRFEFARIDNNGEDVLIQGSIGDNTDDKSKDLIFNNLEAWEVGDVVKINTFAFNLPNGGSEYM